MQAALEAELEEHLAAEAERIGGRGSRSCGNGRNGYRTKKVMSEVGPITLQIPYRFRMAAQPVIWDNAS